MTRTVAETYQHAKKLRRENSSLFNSVHDYNYKNKDLNIVFVKNYCAQLTCFHCAFNSDTASFRDGARECPLLSLKTEAIEESITKKIEEFRFRNGLVKEKTH